MRRPSSLTLRLILGAGLWTLFALIVVGVVLSFLFRQTVERSFDARLNVLLESLIVEYPGTVLLVSHDRAFLNEVATHTLVFEGDGAVKEYAGGYDDWINQKQAGETARREEQAAVAAASKTEPSAATKPAARPRKLSFKEQRELEQLPKQIDAIEVEQRALHGAMAEPSFYQQDGATIAKARQRLEVLEQELAVTFDRWQTLEASAQ